MLIWAFEMFTAFMPVKGSLWWVSKPHVIVRAAVPQTTANTLAEEDFFSIPQAGSCLIQPPHHPAGTAENQIGS